MSKKKSNKLVIKRVEKLVEEEAYYAEKLHNVRYSYHHYSSDVQTFLDIGLVYYFEVITLVTWRKKMDDFKPALLFFAIDVFLIVAIVILYKSCY